ncbi:MAG: hypothetical protein HY665_09000 [Chloroflexi bacterium]|nr:hypothetical protein [Chloroflexota bacterium]
MIIRTVIVIAGIAVVVLGRGLFFFKGSYTPPTTEMPTYEQVIVSPAPIYQFSDNVSENAGKTVLIDLAHGNNFEMEQINGLLQRLIARGMAVRLLNDGDNLKKELLGEEKKTETADEKEKSATENQTKKVKPLPDALVVISPEDEFNKEEKDAIDEFVDNGGRLLLINDPGRGSSINEIALEFGLIFESDYLYNQKENEINFRNIYVTEFKDNDITKNLKKIVLYVSGSISSADAGIAFVDQNTHSSVIESRKRLSPMALAEKSKVLAVNDLSFVTEPYSAAFDNNRLVANIADWIAKASVTRK